MDVDLEKLAEQGQITEMLIRGLISTGLHVGMAVGDQTSMAAADAIVGSLTSAVLAGMAVPASSPLAMPSALPRLECPAVVHVDAVEACCQDNRAHHECTEHLGHRGPHKCGWCDHRFGSPSSHGAGGPTMEALKATQPPRCVAHGTERCYWCSLNPSTCAPELCAAQPACSVYAADGMHWDTCPNRIRGPEGQCAESKQLDGSFNGYRNPRMQCIRPTGHDGDCDTLPAQRYSYGFNDPFLGRP